MSLEKVDDKKVDSFKNSSKKLETILQSQNKTGLFLHFTCDKIEKK